MKKLLVYGFGNPGRRDDGLGIKLVEKLEKWAIEEEYLQLYFDSNYQLNIEDAFELKQYDFVLFADASQEDMDDFIISRVEASAKVDFTTHSVSPSYLKYIAEDLFGYSPQVYLLHMKGYEWQLEEGLSEQAEKNLYKSLLFTQNLLAGLLGPEPILKDPLLYYKNSAL